MLKKKRTQAPLPYSRFHLPYTVHPKVKYTHNPSPYQAAQLRYIDSIEKLLARVLDGEDMRIRVHGALEHMALSGADIVHPAVDLESPLLHGLLDVRVLEHRANLLHDVELHKLIALLLGRQAGQLLVVLCPDLANSPKPAVDESQLLVAERRVDTSTAVVAAHDDVLDLEDLDGVLKDTQRREIVRREEVGDVAVDEDFSWLEIENCGLRNAGIGAPVPEDLGGLALREGGEQGGVGRSSSGGPFAIAVEDACEEIVLTVCCFIRLVIISRRQSFGGQPYTS